MHFTSVPCIYKAICTSVETRNLSSVQVMSNMVTLRGYLQTVRRKFLTSSNSALDVCRDLVHVVSLKLIHVSSNVLLCKSSPNGTSFVFIVEVCQSIWSVITLSFLKVCVVPKQLIHPCKTNSSRWMSYCLPNWTVSHSGNL
jgi:hypothetical protein